MNRVILTILLVLVGGPFLRAQQESTDTPVLLPQCPDQQTGTMAKLIGTCPHDETVHPYHKQVRYFTYRAKNQPPLRTNKQILKDWKFIVPHVLGATAGIVACSRKYSGEKWASESPGWGAIIFVDFLSYKYVGAPNTLGPPGYQIYHYTRTASK